MQIAGRVAQMERRRRTGSHLEITAKDKGYLSANGKYIRVCVCVSFLFLLVFSIGF